jgi:hypothetical protein
MFLVVNSTAYSEPEDPITKLIWLINHEAEKPEMDITQASASNCTPTVETLRLAPDRSIISTSTTVSLSALHGNNSASFLTLGKEDGGAGFSYFVTEETATATYRVDNPSSSKRRWFRKRFGQRCWGNDMCQTDYVPKSLYFRVPSSSPAERTELTDTFRDAIDYCRRQVG